MSMDKRIIYDSDELIQIIESQMDRLRPFRYDRKYRELLGERLIDKLCSWDKVIHSQKNSPLTVVVCGEFKRGKSSLINAILGEDVVTTNVTTETITTNKIIYGNHSNEIVLSGGRRMKLADDELRSEKLKEILAGLPDKATTLELKRPLEILKKMTVIDTPGLGDALCDFSVDVEEALRQADAVIYVFSVLYPLSVQEQMFLRSAIRPQQYTELFLVGNYCDAVESREGCERVKTAIIERMKDILPGEEPFMLSALDERCRQLGTKRPNEEQKDYLASDFDEFRDSIEDLLQNKKDMLIPDRIQRLMQGMLADIGSDLDTMYAGLRINSDLIVAKREEWSTEKDRKIREQEEIFAAIDKKITIYKAETIDWITELIQLMKSDTENLQDVSVEDIKKYYSLYCVDTLQEAFDKCMRNFMNIIYDELDRVSGEVSKKMSYNTVSSVDFKLSLNNRTWTKGDNVAYVGTVVQSFLGIGQLIGNFVGGMMRQNEMKKNAPDIIKEINAQYPELLNSTISAVSEKYDEFAEKAKQQLSEYFTERINNIEERAEEAEMVARQDSDVKDAIQSALDEIRGIMESIRDEMMITNAS